MCAQIGVFRLVVLGGGWCLIVVVPDKVVWRVLIVLRIMALRVLLRMVVSRVVLVLSLINT